MISTQRRLDRISIKPCDAPGTSLEKCLAAILLAFERNPETARNCYYDRSNGHMEQLTLEQCHLQVKGVARESGLEARELHPPDAAPVPLKPPEFDLHWRDSYLPFVKVALGRDEPILASGGWPEEAGSWGIITKIDVQNRCSGQTCSGFREMIGPALLAYVFNSKD